MYHQKTKPAQPPIKRPPTKPPHNLQHDRQEAAFSPAMIRYRLLGSEGDASGRYAGVVWVADVKKADGLVSFFSIFLR
jgi:hypothetical protein